MICRQTVCHVTATVMVTTGVIPILRVRTWGEEQALLETTAERVHVATSPKGMWILDGTCIFFVAFMFWV